MSDREHELVKSSKRGDVKAFETLIESYQKKVYNIALKMMGNPEDANDLAQESFIRVFKSIDKFKEQSSFSTWIYRITTNICLDELRKRKNKKTFSIDEDIKYNDIEIPRQIQDEGPLPEDILESKETSQIVRKAINCLSDQHKTVLVLRDIEGFSYEEICKITNCPEGTVKSRINRARSALKDILKNRKELFRTDCVK